MERLTTARQEREKEVQKELKKALKWKDTVVKKMKDMDINLEYDNYSESQYIYSEVVCLEFID